jgi:hypothetical protein
VGLLQAALARLGRPPARVVPWLEVARGEALDLSADVVRLESAGGDLQVHRALLALGAPDAPPEAGAQAWRRPIGLDGGERLSAAAALALPEDGSGLRYAAQRHRGLLRALGRVADALPDGARCLTPPGDVAALCDKAATWERLRAAGLPVAPRLAAGSPEALEASMAAAGVTRAFIKPRWGSSAAGVAAWDRGAGALTTSLRFDGEVPFSSLRLARLEAPTAIGRALRWICSEGAHAEAWLPKETLDDREFDLRVVVIAGRARHTVARVARHGKPMTNLHLGNDRGDLAAARARVGPARWAETLALCEAAAAAFPRSHCVGADVAIVPGRGPVLIELNAFGDLLPGVLHQGQDTYEAQLTAL